MKTIFRSILVIFILCVFASCSAKPLPVPVSTEILLTTDRLELQPGECTLLHWKVSSGFGVTLDGQPVQQTGEKEVCPTETHAYELAVDLGTTMERRTLAITILGGNESTPAATEPPATQTQAPMNIQPGTPAYLADAWVSLKNPPGDLGYDIRYNFNDHNIWYVTDGGAGFHISTDRGVTWKPSNNGIQTLEGTASFPVFSATVDPHDPDIIWVGTQFTGQIYKSTDGGLNWIEMDNGVEPNIGLHFRGFTVDPRSSDIVYAQAEVDHFVFTNAGKTVKTKNTTCVGGRIYRTKDGGENWSLIWEGDALARYLWVNPQNPEVLYASTGIFDRCPLNGPDTSRTAWDAGGLGIIKSTDGGKTWVSLGKEHGMEMLHVSSLYMKPDNPETLLAGTGSLTLGGEGNLPGTVYLTKDGGENWVPVVTGDDAIGAVEYCEQNPQIAIAAGSRAVYRSEDGGETWAKYQDASRDTWGPVGNTPGVPIDIQTDPDYPDCSRVFINNYIGGNYLSEDGGKSWVLSSKGYSGAKVTGLEVSNTDQNLVYAGVRMALFVSKDAGQTWESISNPEMKVGVLNLAVDPFDDNHILTVEGERGYLAPWLMESKDGGASWKKVFHLQVPEGISDFDWGTMKLMDIQFAPSDPKIVYASSLNPPVDGDHRIPENFIIGDGMYKSLDGGTTWSEANDANIGSLGFDSIAVHPIDSQTVYAAEYTGKLFKTTDGGKNWSQLSANSSIMAVKVVIDPISPEIVLVGGKNGLFRSEDGGNSWKQLTTGLSPETTLTDIVIDPMHEGVIYVSTSREGMLYSIDDGETFMPLRQGLEFAGGNLPVIMLALSPDGSILYAGTTGLAVYRLGNPLPTVP